MKLNIHRDNEFDISTSIGELHIDSIRVGAMDELIALDDNSNLGHLKKLLSLVAKKEVDLKALSYDDIEKLTDEDLEIISAKFLEHNDYIIEKLNKGIELKNNKNRKAEFLNELLKDYIKNEKKELDDFLKKQNPFKDLLKDKKKFDNLFSANYNISRHLEEGIKAIASIQRDTTDYNELLKPPPHPSNETNNKIQIIIEQINGYRPIVLESVKLVKNMNDIVIEILNKFITNTRQSTRYNRILISIAVVTLVISTIISFLNYQATKNTNEGVAPFQEAIIKQSLILDSLLLFQNKNNLEVKELFKRQEEILISKKSKSINKIDTLKIINNKIHKLLNVN